ncbi:MAG: hypothetical protein K6T92_02055 [Candidatus Rokubacteria bacterium]|nr:hypothetical protein [Candidatus Rokubacteria bacterium]
MRRRTLESLRLGVEAALAASVPQVLLPKLEEKLLLAPGESADVGPRFVERLAAMAGRRLPEDIKWLAASAFHFGYAALWGALYALVWERRPVSPVLGGTALAGLIYLITFTPWGGAVRTGTEAPPARRSRRQELVLATAPLVFGVLTALIYGRGPRPQHRPLPTTG